MAEKSPRNVRNFWLEVEVDGRKEKIACGPVNKQGGMRLVLHQRNKGKVERVLTINCNAFTDMDTGEITLWSTVRNDEADKNFPSSWGFESPMRYETER